MLAAGLVAFMSVSAMQANGAVLTPQSAPYGKSYSQWSASYWQWLFSLPVAGHPGIDSPDFDVTEGQSGNVWFLTGPFGTVERNVTIPAGKALFIALINVDSSTLEEPPFYGATAADQLSSFYLSLFEASFAPGLFCHKRENPPGLHIFRLTYDCYKKRKETLQRIWIILWEDFTASERGRCGSDNLSTRDR